MRTLVAFLVSSTLVGCGPDAPTSPFTDPNLARIHTRMMEALAPDGGWERARYIEFTFGSGSAEAAAAGRRHRWDRQTGDYRIEVPGEGGDVVALFNTSAPASGRAWIGGIEVQDSAVAGRLLDQSWGRFVNDTRWFLMPFMWTDPGVGVDYLGERTDEDGMLWEVVELSFDDSVGVGSEQRFEALINPETGRMERWSQYLGTSGSEPRVVADWTDWQRYGPLVVATARPYRNAPGGVFFPDIRIEEAVPPGAFEPPTPGGG